MLCLLTESDRKKYSLKRVNCALGPSKSIRYGDDFALAGFVFTYSQDICLQTLTSFSLTRAKSLMRVVGKSSFDLVKSFTH